MHRHFLSRLKGCYQAPWTPDTLAADLDVLLDSCLDFRDFLVPAMHPVKPLVEKALRHSQGLHLCYHQHTLNVLEVQHLVKKVVKPLLLDINKSLRGYDGIPLAPYFPPSVDAEDTVALEDQQEKVVRKKEVRKMTMVKDIAQLERLTTRHLREGVARMKGRSFTLIEDVGIIPPLYDYEKKISGVDKVDVSHGDFGYLALYGESLLVIDEDFHEDKRGAKVGLEGDKALKNARAAQRARAKQMQQLEADVAEISAKITKADKLKNEKTRKERLADLRETLKNVEGEIAKLQQLTEMNHDSLVGMRRAVREQKDVEFDEATTTTLDDILVNIAKKSGQRLVLMSDKPKRLPKEYGGGRIALYWVGREAHLRRLVSKLPATTQRGKFVEWDIVGRDG